MTIRSNIDAREAHRFLLAFEEGCANAPEGTMELAKATLALLGNACDELLDKTRALGFKDGSGDAIREIEILMFDNIRRSDPIGAVVEATCFGFALQEQHYQMDRDALIQRVAREGFFAATRDDWIRYGLEVQA